MMELVMDSAEEHLMVDVFVTAFVIITEIVVMTRLTFVEMNLVQGTT